MALNKLKVVELAGLAPVPFCGMILSDFGATVIRVDKTGPGGFEDCLGNGKRSIALNLKHPKGVDVLRALCRKSDVLIEPFRTGVMERLGLGPDVLMKENPRLIYARLTGYGQTGSFSQNAGHDINYTALSGLLSLFGRKEENPVFPANVVADFGGGGLMCALGILLALNERNTSGLGQIVDNSMVKGSAYLGSWLYRSQHMPMWGQDRGENVLDSGVHFYEVYKTKDGKYVSVGAIEPQFYAELIKGLGLTIAVAPQFGDFANLKKILSEKFLEKTRQEWCDIFDKTDACVAPVLSIEEAPEHEHNIQDNTFLKTDHGVAPNPAPLLSRTPGKSKSIQKLPHKGEHTKQILQSLDFSLTDIEELENDRIIECHLPSKL